MILDEIISINKIGTEYTVDIEVDGDHLFYCNDILTHNSAAGETNEITEENIQGGISKIQAADNALAFIPNASTREAGLLKAKLLKTRDSGGVGSYITFDVDWSTLSFNPKMDVVCGTDGSITYNNTINKGKSFKPGSIPSSTSQITTKSVKDNIKKSKSKKTTNIDNGVGDLIDEKSITNIMKKVPRKQNGIQQLASNKHRRGGVSSI